MKELSKIIENFEYVKTTRSKVYSMSNEIKQKIEYLNKIYIELVKTHANKEFTFGLDSFYFQTKILEVENENMNKLLNLVTNQCYCEYYKLYKIIEHYIIHDIKDVKLKEKILQKKPFPVYKDLDKNINYDFSLTIEIQRIIIKYINDLNDYLRIKNIDLKDDSQHSSIGINIENIINYQFYCNALLHEQILMYVRYLEALNKHHTKYIQRLFIVSKSTIDAVNEDIITKQSNNSREKKEEKNNASMLIIEESPLASEPVASVAEPVASVAEPLASVAEPLASVAEPLASVAEKLASVAEPLASVAEPLASVAEPLASLAEPFLIKNSLPEFQENITITMEINDILT
jgi:hypothetical protein